MSHHAKKVTQKLQENSHPAPAGFLHQKQLGLIQTSPIEKEKRPPHTQVSQSVDSVGQVSNCNDTHPHVRVVEDANENVWL